MSSISMSGDYLKTPTAMVKKLITDGKFAPISLDGSNMLGDYSLSSLRKGAGIDLDNQYDAFFRRFSALISLMVLANKITPYTQGLETNFQSIQGIYSRILRFPFIHTLSLTGIEINESKFSNILSTSISAKTATAFIDDIDSVFNLRGKFKEEIEKFEVEFFNIVSEYIPFSSLNSTPMRDWVDAELELFIKRHIPSFQRIIIPAESIITHLKCVNKNVATAHRPIFNLTNDRKYRNWADAHCNGSLTVTNKSNIVEIKKSFESQYEKINLNFTFFYDTIKEFFNSDYILSVFDSSVNNSLTFISLLHYQWYNSGWVQPFVKMQTAKDDSYKKRVIQSAVNRYVNGSNKSLFLVDHLVTPEKQQIISNLFCLSNLKTLLISDLKLLKAVESQKRTLIFREYRHALSTFHYTSIIFTEKQKLFNIHAKLSNCTDITSFFACMKGLPPLVVDVISNSSLSAAELAANIDANVIKLNNVLSQRLIK